MINFINKTVEILAHILYNKGQANQEGLLAFYTIIEQEDKNMSLKDFDYKRVVFLQQVFCSELQVSKHFPARMLRIYIQRQQQLYFAQRIAY